MTRKETRRSLRTDSGNAELFAAQCGKVVKFDHAQGRWLIWHPKQGRWVEDRLRQVRTLMKNTARLRLREATHLSDDEEHSKEIRWALRSENRRAIDDALELAKSIPPVADTGMKWDGNPWLLGVKNGIVDLRTGRLRSGQPEDRVTLYSPVAFDPAAKCPRFETFLLEVFGGDRELVDFIQRAVGYTLTGCVDEQCFFCCYGAGANGKSTFLDVLRYLLGDYAVNLPFTALELKDRSSISNDVAMLAGRRFATAIETGESVRLNEARIKAITGGDPITARRLYHENFTFPPTHKLWLAFNHKPRIADESEGMWRRVQLIPFNRHFAEGQRDRKLLDTLKSEAAGILAWAVEGVLRWQKKGLGRPQAVTDATARYRRESNHLERFLGECCILDPGARVASAALWECYRRWVSERGEASLSRTVFTERLLGRGFTMDRFGHQGTRGWRGVGLADSQSERTENTDVNGSEEVPSLADFVEESVADADVLTRADIVM